MKWLTKLFCSKKSINEAVIKANVKSAELLGWTPRWFGATDFDDTLIDRVKKTQKQFGLEPDGVVDTSTFRRRVTEKEAVRVVIDNIETPHIICNGKEQRINWDKVVTYKNQNGLVLPKTHYRSWKNNRNVSMFVVHWDVCLSSKTCYNILKKRKLSVHFMIDNDGTIYQLMDTKHAAWHAGNRKVNNKSVGVEISDAYYPKYQKVYEMKGFGKRPIWVNDVEHAKEKGDKFLGFYDIQLEALKALTEALHEGHGIKLQVPTDSNGMVKTIYSKAAQAKFEGVVNHYHLTKRKIDCAALKLDEIVREVAENV